MYVGDKPSSKPALEAIHLQTIFKHKLRTLSPVQEQMRLLSRRNTATDNQTRML